MSLRVQTRCAKRLLAGNLLIYRRVNFLKLSNTFLRFAKYCVRSRDPAFLLLVSAMLEVFHIL